MYSRVLNPFEAKGPDQAKKKMFGLDGSKQNGSDKCKIMDQSLAIIPQAAHIASPSHRPEKYFSKTPAISSGLSST